MTMARSYRKETVFGTNSQTCKRWKGQKEAADQGENLEPKQKKI